MTTGSTASTVAEASKAPIRESRRFDLPTTIQLAIAVGTLLTAGAAFLTALSTKQQLRAAQQQNEAMQKQVRAAKQQNEAMRMQLSVATLEQLENEFESARMVKARRAAATALLHRQETRPVDDVLDFFETVALLVNRHAVEPEMVWNTFYYWIDGYGRTSDGVTVEERQRHPVEWQDLDALRGELERIETAKGGQSPPTSAADLHDFLVEESELK